MSMSRPLSALLTAAVTLAVVAPAWADDLALAVATPPAPAIPTVPAGGAAAEVAALQARLAALEAKRSENWLTAERTSQIKAIVNDVLADAQSHHQGLDGIGLKAGYKDGFFIQSDEAKPKFKLAIAGYFQYRYTYGHTELAYPTSTFAPNTPKTGDFDSFDYRRLRLYFSGNVFDPNLIYCVSGDFKGSASNTGLFQILDVYAGYKFSDNFAIRAGSFLVPFTHVEIAGPGAQFTEGPTIFFPFDPIRAIGVSALGYIIKDQLSYEFNVNNGQRSQPLANVAQTGTAPNYDNRLAFYTRWQYAGAGTIPEFNDEPDLAWHKNLAWMIGFAAGYESQNSNASSFPSPQSSLTVQGLSSASSPGFVNPVTLNGNMYRATVDAHAKYQGWGLTATGYIEQVNSSDPASSAFVSSYGSSTFIAGYFVQAGYFVIPKKLEIVGRFGQLLTNGQPNRMEEYSLGLNYYIIGHNIKIQTDVTWIPNEAAFTDVNSATVINTQDLIYRAQLQVKF